MLVALVPGLVFEVGPLGAGSLAAVFAGFTGLLAGFAFGGRFAVLVATIAATLQFVAFPMASHPVGAGMVMAVTALLYGLSSRRGATSSIVFAPIAVLVTLTLPPDAISGRSTMVTAAVVALGALVGGLWGSAAGLWARRRVPHAAPNGVTAPIAWVYAIAMAVATGLSMALVLGTGTHQGGEWLVLTLFVVGQPNEHGTWAKALQRLGGTAIGFAIVFTVTSVVASPTVYTALAVGFAIAAVVARFESRPYWQYVIVLTPAVVFAEGAGTDVVHLDVLRLEYTVLGAIVAMAMLAVLRFVARRSPRLQRALHVPV